MNAFWKQIVVGLAIILLASGIEAQYYYSDNRQIPLLIDSSKVTIAFNIDMDLDTIAAFQVNYGRIDSLIEGAENIADFRTYALNTETEFDQFIDTLRNDARLRMVNPYYMYAPGEKFLIGEAFCCKFFSSTTYGYIDSLNSVNGVEIIYEKNYAPKEYLLRVSPNATRPTLEMANYYYELPEVEYSHPDFLGGFVLDGATIYDYYWSYQWAMQRVFNSSETQPEITAFEITAGSPDIIIAVLDDGVAAHEDIPASRILPGYDFSCGDDSPVPCNKPRYGYHGMACAGIIGAGYTVDSGLQYDANTGVCGIAPNCKILPIKIFGSDLKDTLYPECCLGTTTSVRARAIDTARIMGADILANSWHIPVPSDDILFATNRAADLGRDGKGCGIFHSAGNDGDSRATYPNLLEKVISVGAIDPNDEIWDYSNYGKIDVVAPAGSDIAYVDKIWSTDQMAELGGNITGDDYDCSTNDDVDYLCSFGRTSSAQPVAAGVGALVLSRRPDLTGAQLREVIRKSADSNLYDTIIFPPDPKYGYGMVHPLRALLAITRGDANNDGIVDVGDARYLINYVYSSGAPPQPDVLTGDADCSGDVNAGDPVYLINYIFKDGPPPQICFEY